MSGLDTHFNLVAKMMLRGRVVPFLGAGVNLCGRPRDVKWTPRTDQHLPSGAELSKHLAESFNFPLGDASDLARVAQYITVMLGSDPLYLELHRLFARDYPPTPLHRFFAELPRRLRAARADDPFAVDEGTFPLIITTNYDDVLERAFLEAGEEFDLVTYVAAEGENRGRFTHTPPHGEPEPIMTPNEYVGVPSQMRPVIMKIHGAVDRLRPDGERDSFVITEDDYIDYLARTKLSDLPKMLGAMVHTSHLLFLGYGLRDWNLRVMLHRIVTERKRTRQWWAVQEGPTELDRKFWSRRGIEIIDIDLLEYITALRQRLTDAPPMTQTIAHAG
jgi:hypothetical protein